MKRFYCLLMALVVFVSLVTAGCESEPDDDDDDAGVDSVTSASPGADSSLLTEEHSGWKNPDCFFCHEQAHLDGFLGGECVTCHGANGAPQRVAGHANTDCASCHSDTHPDLGFASPKHCTACHKYEPGIECPVTEEVDVVVIGAGGGGLGAAALLAKNGMKVALIERHYKVGGYMNTFHRGDYTFEASLHAMGGLDTPEDSKGTISDFMELGILDRLQPIKCDPMYRSIFPELTLEIPADIDQYKALLMGTFPAEAGGIDALFREIEVINEVLDAVSGFGSGFNFDDLMTLLSNPGAVFRLISYLNMTVKEMVEQFVHDPRLVGLFTQLVTYLGAGPDQLQAVYFMTMWTSYHAEGFYYFTGGSQSVSEAMADVIRENGGDIRLNTLATKIVIENGTAVQVRTLNDACYNTRYVVSNANAPDTLLNMVGEQYLPADYVEKITAMTLGAATLQVFLGVNRDYRDLFPGSHEIMINETSDLDESFVYIQEGRIDKAPFIITNYTQVDPTDAPAGKNVISLTTYLPFDMEDNWRWNQGYEQYKQYKTDVANVLIERAEQYLPELAQHVEVMEVGTPITNYAYFLNPGGTIFGWANTPSQGTIRRPGQQTPIENLYLAGAWTFPGGGQSAVINSGMAAAKSILGEE